MINLRKIVAVLAIIFPALLSAGEYYLRLGDFGPNERELWKCRLRSEYAGTVYVTDSPQKLAKIMEARDSLIEACNEPDNVLRNRTGTLEERTRRYNLALQHISDAVDHLKAVVDANARRVQ